eukprot:749009_1
MCHNHTFGLILQPMSRAMSSHKSRSARMTFVKSKTKCVALSNPNVRFLSFQLRFMNSLPPARDRKQVKWACSAITTGDLLVLPCNKELACLSNKEMLLRQEMKEDVLHGFAD